MGLRWIGGRSSVAQCQAAEGVSPPVILPRIKSWENAAEELRAQFHAGGVTCRSRSLAFSASLGLCVFYNRRGVQCAAGKQRPPKRGARKRPDALVSFCAQRFGVRRVLAPLSAPATREEGAIPSVVPSARLRPAHAGCKPPEVSVVEPFATGAAGFGAAAAPGSTMMRPRQFASALAQPR